MDKRFIIIAAILVLLLSILACTKQPSTNPVAMANPASEKCIADGGQDKILNEPDGQYGLCLFPDGSVCDEWAYFRGECAKGACLRKCDAIGSRSEGWYDCNGKLLFWDTCANESAVTAGTC